MFNNNFPNSETSCNLLPCKYNLHCDKMKAIAMKSGAKEQIFIHSCKFFQEK